MKKIILQQNNEVVEMNDKLWYKKPADQWNEGLPIGNGRLAAMVIGDPDRERIALNHEWLWRGINKDRDNKKRAQYSLFFFHFSQI